MNKTLIDKATLLKVLPAAFVLLLAVPASAQDTPPTAPTTQSVDTQAQMKAEDEARQDTPPTTTSNDAAPTTSNEAVPMTSNEAPPPTSDQAQPTTGVSTDTMTSNDASAAMQSTGAGTAATATTGSVVLPTANVTVTSRPGDPIAAGYRPEFRALDVDQDGLLSRREAAKDAKVQQQFAALDTDHDGRLSRTETESVIN